MIEIREAKEADAAGLLAIYAPYVEHTAITFEYEVPTLEEFTERIRQTETKYPYLVVCVCRAVSCQRSVCMGG